MGLKQDELDDLEDLLQRLLDNGVEEFSGHGISVKFGASAPHSSEYGGKVIDDDARAKKTSSNQWDHPALWGPQGKPPEFPKK